MKRQLTSLRIYGIYFSLPIRLKKKLKGSKLPYWQGQEETNSIIHCWFNLNWHILANNNTGISLNT